MSRRWSRRSGGWAAAILLAVAAWSAWVWWRGRGEEVPPGFARGNGRIEATEIHVATRLAGRIEEILVEEGDFFAAEAPLARMQTDTLEAERSEAAALRHEARGGVAAAQAALAMRRSERASAEALRLQRRRECEHARRRVERAEAAGIEGAVSPQEIDDDRTSLLIAEAALAAAEASVAAAESAIAAADSMVRAAESTVEAREATVRRIEADLEDSILRSPRSGRVQYRIAQPGEVLAAGGRVLSVVDLSDVSMTFFLAEREAGRLALGAEARLVLDAAPSLVVPAEISFVASTAQFTPKTVETAEERQKLMFRIRARIDPALLRLHAEHVKAGLPGVAWVRIDSHASWPAFLATTPRFDLEGGTAEPAAEAAP